MTKRVTNLAAWMVVAVCLASAGRVFAQAMPNVPILENTTYALIRLDLSKIDGDGVTKWMLEGGAKVLTDPAQKQQFEQMIQRSFAKLIEGQKALVQAKATVFYFAFNEFPPNSGPLVFAQVAPGGDVEAVRTVIFSGPGGRNKGPEVASARPGQPVAAVIGDGVMYGRIEDYQRLKQPHAGAPHLLFALSQAPPAALQAVAAPTEAMSLLLETIYPQIPPPIDLPTMILTRGVSSTVGTLQAPPDAAVRIVMQTQDAATAAQLKGVGEKLLAMMNSPQIKSQVPPGFDIQALVTALTPKVQENQVIIELSGEQTSALALSAILPSMARAQGSALMVQSAAQLRAIVMGIMQHAQENQNTLPDSMDQLAARFGGRVVPSNPRGAAGQPGYIYVKPATKLSDVKSTMILVYENIAALPPGTTTVNAGYGDGHVDAIPISVLTQRLTAQGTPPAK